MNTVSVIIVSWNTRELLAQCLRSVGASLMTLRPDDVEICVVDNASRDGSAEMVAQVFPQVDLIWNQENVGFARASNQAIAQSRGRYVLLLNPDTRLHPRALDNLVQFMENHPDAGAAGSRLLGSDGRLQISCTPAPTIARELWRLLHLDRLYPFAQYRMRGWSTQNPRAVDVVQGASMLIRRAALDQVGVLDEEYFIYTEEVDLCHRIRQAGWRVFWVPSSTVTHYGGQSTRQAAESMFLLLYQTKLLYFRKHHGASAARTYKFILCLTGILRVILGPLVALISPSRRAQQTTIIRNYRRLLAELPAL